MRKKVAGVLIILFFSLFLTGCCEHEWIEASCVAPRTCILCGKTDGELAPHIFSFVSCDEPMVCSLCGMKGEIPGHTWTDATCVQPKTCVVCQKTDGEALGHSTRYGTCTRCKEFVNDLEYKDHFAVVTYNDTVWMQELDDFLDVYVIGTITGINQVNDVSITDSEGRIWTVAVGTACDLSEYMNTVCEVYGFSNGGTSSQHDTPLINMDHEDNCIVFSDGKELHPEVDESTVQFANKDTSNTVTGSDFLVWIPTNGGTKYHSFAGCSQMIDPIQVTEAEAINSGFGKCGRCW